MEDESIARQIITSEINETIYSTQNEPTTERRLERWLICLKNITLEPCIFIFFVVLSMDGPLFAEIMLQKVIIFCFLSGMWIQKKLICVA